MDPKRQQQAQRFEAFADPDAGQLFERARERMQAGDEAAAVPLLAEVVARCPENVLAMRCYQYAAKHVGGDAERAMRGHYESMPDSATSPVPAFAKSRLIASNFARKAALDELLRVHPDFADGWLELGTIQRGIGRIQDAVASFEAAIVRNPKLLAAHRDLAECLAELERNPEAQVAYENYLRAAPNDRDAARAYVQLTLYRTGKPKAARPWLDRLVADDPLDDSVRMDLAACEWLSGNPGAALEGYIGVLQRRPEDARAALNIGYLHFDAFAKDDAQKRVHWPKARAAFLLFLQTVRPADGHDYFERSFAVPFRLKQIEEVLGPPPTTKPTLDDLR